MLRMSLRMLAFKALPSFARYQQKMAAHQSIQSSLFAFVRPRLVMNCPVRQVAIYGGIEHAAVSN
jgi:hypothetical protein